MECNTLSDLLNFSEKNIVIEAVTHLKSKIEFRNEELLSLQREKQVFEKHYTILLDEYNRTKEKHIIEIDNLKNKVEQLKSSEQKSNAEILKLNNKIQELEKTKTETKQSNVKKSHTQSANYPKPIQNHVSSTSSYIVARHPNHVWYKVKIIKQDTQNNRFLVKFNWVDNAMWVNADEVKELQEDSKPSGSSSKYMTARHPNNSWYRVKILTNDIQKGKYLVRFNFENKDIWVDAENVKEAYEQKSNYSKPVQHSTARSTSSSQNQKTTKKSIFSKWFS